MKAAGAGLAVVLLVAVGCGNPPTTAVVPPPTSRPLELTSEALAAFQRGQMEEAATLWRRALASDPMSVTAHYYLAVTATHLNRREEAVTEFRWVLEHAGSTSREAEVARKWLADAGMLPRANTKTAAETFDDTVGSSSVRGQVVGTDATPAGSTSRLQLFLKGLPNTPTANLQYVLRTDQEGRFEFKSIPGGAYKLTNRIAGRPQWRLRVEIPAGDSVAVDLTAQNSLGVRDDFPEDGS